MKRAFLTVAVIGAFSFGCDGNEGDECDPPCGDSQACCDGTCVFTISSATNCGGCGIVCPSGRCNNGVCAPAIDSGPVSDCRPECTMNQRCCGTRCVDRAVPQNTDGRTNPSFENCNGCGIACDPERAVSCSVPGGGTGTSRCLCGDFDQCLAGEVCVSNGGSYGCVSLSTDPRNCGAIGNSCGEGLTCSGGMCLCGTEACGDGETCCEGTCGTGTCCPGVGFVDTQTDQEHCGACGNACTVNAPNCVEGACTCEIAGRACEAPVPGGFLGDPVLGESCCPGVGCVANSDSNCACLLCSDEVECLVSGGAAIPGLPGSDEPVSVCCGVETIIIVPTPMFGVSCEGSLPLPTDGGVPGDGGVTGDAGVTSDAGSSAMDAGGVDAGVDGG